MATMHYTMSSVFFFVRVRCLVFECAFLNYSKKDLKLQILKEKKWKMHDYSFFWDHYPYDDCCLVSFFGFSPQLYQQQKN
jgi:hypothetical protein